LHFQEPIVDLLAGKTAALVSWIKFLLHSQLASYAPKQMLLKRIDYELHQRIVHPWLTRSNWKWQGFDGKRVNNWNPWINTNLLQTCLLAMDDVKTRSEMLTKVIKSIDHWINWQPNDGGCDEGPSYWGLSVGEFATFLDLLSSASAGKISWLNNVNTTLFHRMGRYIASCILIRIALLISATQKHF